MTPSLRRSLLRWSCTRDSQASSARKGATHRRGWGSSVSHFPEPTIPRHEGLQHMRHQRRGIDPLAIGLRMHRRIAVQRGLQLRRQGDGKLDRLALVQRPGRKPAAACPGALRRVCGGLGCENARGTPAARVALPKKAPANPERSAGACRVRQLRPMPALLRHSRHRPHPQALVARPALQRLPSGPPARGTSAAASRCLPPAARPRRRSAPS